MKDSFVVQPVTAGGWDGRTQGNYWRKWEWPVDTIDIAVFMVIPCVDVFAAGSACSVAVEVDEAMPNKVP